jgi:hypothetical protein
MPSLTGTNQSVKQNPEISIPPEQEGIQAITNACGRLAINDYFPWMEPVSRL